MATCRSCDAEIEWARTEHGKSIPLDVGTRADGNIRVVSRVATERGMAPLIRYVGRGEGDRVSHFATCPNATEHRKGNR